MRRRLLVAGLLGAMSAVLAISPATASSAERPDAEPRSPQPVKHPIERVLIISLPGVGWRELSGQHLPNLRRVLEGAAVADLSTRAPLLREDLAGNYASLNAGDKAVGPRDEIDRTGVAPAGAAYNVDERLTGTTAGEVFTHRTGRAAGAGLVVLGVGQVAAANAATPYRAKIGALGDVLAGAGWTRSVIANGDGLDVGLLAGLPRRAAAIA